LIRRKDFKPTGPIEVVLADLDPYVINLKEEKADVNDIHYVDVPNGDFRMTDSM
jgi:hypothetical protein